MADLFKNIYNAAFLEQFLSALNKAAPTLDLSRFENDVFDDHWPNRELKQRMRHLSTVLRRFLGDDYARNVKVIINLVNNLRQAGVEDDGLAYMFLPDFIEVYGLEDYDISIRAIETITQFVSCEFGIRPFIIAFPEQAMEQMLNWSAHQHQSVRRLSSEGCRPRLPWGIAIPFLKADPSPILPILRKLRNDDSESVRRSVANNLNDISKDHADVVIDLVKKWKGESKQVDWVVKHASRTLLKQANPEIMEVFGFGNLDQIGLDQFSILTPAVTIGEHLEFRFRITNKSRSPLLIRLEYGLYFQKANGSLSKKVFKISERTYPKHSATTINRKQSFRKVTTRKLYKGLHQVSVIINGHEFNRHNFQLI